MAEDLSSTHSKRKTVFFLFFCRVLFCCLNGIQCGSFTCSSMRLYLVVYIYMYNMYFVHSRKFSYFLHRCLLVFWGRPCRPKKTFYKRISRLHNILWNGGNENVYAWWISVEQAALAITSNVHVIIISSAVRRIVVWPSW